MSSVTVMPAYPKEVVLSDESTMTIRPMKSEDEAALLDFFRRVPAEDRFYLKEDVTSSEVIRQWAENLDYRRVLPLLAVIDGSITADGTLHRRRAGARRHIGEIRIVVDPDYRNRGIGRAIMRELIEVAREAGLEKLELELIPAREYPAVRTATIIGFRPLFRLTNYVKDSSDLPQDLMTMELPLNESPEWMVEDF